MSHVTQHIMSKLSLGVGSLVLASSTVMASSTETSSMSVMNAGDISARVFLGIMETSSEAKVGQSLDLTSLDETGASKSFELTYSITNDIGVEFGVVDQGEASATLRNDQMPAAEYHQKVRDYTPVLVDAITLGANYTYSFTDQVYVQPSLGVFRWNYEITSTSNGSTLTTEDDGTDLYGGITAGFKAVENVSLLARYRYYHLDEAVNEMSLGLGWHF